MFHCCVGIILVIRPTLDLRLKFRAKEDLRERTLFLTFTALVEYIRCEGARVTQGQFLVV